MHLPDTLRTGFVFGINQSFASRATRAREQTFPRPFCFTISACRRRRKHNTHAQHTHTYTHLRPQPHVGGRKKKALVRQDPANPHVMNADVIPDSPFLRTLPILASLRLLPIFAVVAYNVTPVTKTMPQPPAGSHQKSSSVFQSCLEKTTSVRVTHRHLCARTFTDLGFTFSRAALSFPIAPDRPFAPPSFYRWFSLRQIRQAFLPEQSDFLTPGCFFPPPSSSSSAPTRARSKHPATPHDTKQRRGQHSKHISLILFWDRGRWGVEPAI